MSISEFGSVNYPYNNWRKQLTKYSAWYGPVFFKKYFIETYIHMYNIYLYLVVDVFLCISYFKVYWFCYIICIAYNAKLFKTSHMSFSHLLNMEFNNG